MPHPAAAAHAALDGDVAGVFLFDLAAGTLMFGDGLGGGFVVAADGSVAPLQSVEEESTEEVAEEGAASMVARGAGEESTEDSPAAVAVAGQGLTLAHFWAYTRPLRSSP